ncbi:serine/threonine-protein kinase [Hyalangium versicolor]|uniref:serine/threonine-protein kinase n=1 Tax=Hyalangium versicolor TaxID=2861190 RepID=UPI001CCD2ADC|nr:serine/threonine-protein kinase [Hyalangium versicolor]
MPHALSPATEVDPALLAPGTEVNGFRLLRYVDTGGFGCVWQAESIHCPGQCFAVKFNRHPPGEASTGDARALREVQLLLQAAHPNVLGVVGYGRWGDPNTGILYTVLRWVEGGTLLEWACKANPPLRVLVRLSQKLAHALQAAHDNGVLHRDVKPGNVLVSEADGEPFLGDFGLGETEHSPPITQGGSPPGTRYYLSPEALALRQRSGGRPYHFQPADDWYALGVTLYELLTEVLPFSSDKAGTSYEQQALQRCPVPPHLLNPRVPLALSKVVMRLLNKDPHRRFRNGHALWAALDGVLAQVGDWEAPVYESRPPHVPGQTPTLKPTPSDGFVADDLGVALAHEEKREQGHEEQRQAATRGRRDALLPVQPMVWPPTVRRGGGALVLLLAALGLWVVWPPLAATPLTGPAGSPAQTPSPALGQSVVPHEVPPVPPVAFPAPEYAAVPPPEPSLAAITATSQKEDTPVKTPQSSPPSRPSSTPLGRSAAKAAGLAVSCALAAGCPSIPVRPVPKECPPAAINNMRALGIDRGARGMGIGDAWLDADRRRVGEGSFRVGPIVSFVRDNDPGSLPEGSLLFGEVLPGGGKHFFIRWYQAQLPGSNERVPVCAVARGIGVPFFGLEKGPGSTDDTFTHGNYGQVRYVTKFAE